MSNIESNLGGDDNAEVGQNIYKSSSNFIKVGEI